MKILLAAIFCLATTVSFAQQAPDPAFLQRVLPTLQAQRNAALDAQAVAEARAAGLADDLAKANARIKELEAKPEEKK